jgi:myo-inositol-1(or 4)-monophosphatase
VNATVEELSQFALDTIGKLGDKALSFYGKGDPVLKFDERLVTEAELHLSELFGSELASRYPEHQVFSPASGKSDYTHDERRYLWIFDAIDGVANFQAGIPIWGMSIALLENFWPLLGFVSLPATGDVFYAQAGRTAHRGSIAIQVSRQEEINDESLLLTYSRFHQDYQTTFPGKIRSLGCSTAHACYVAMGRADAAVLANDSYAGLAAARVIVEAAGGQIYSMQAGEFHLNDYLDSSKIDDHLLVTSPRFYEEVRPHLQPAR